MVLTGWGQAISEAGAPSLSTRGGLGGAGPWQGPSKALHAPSLPHAAGTPRCMLVQPQRPRSILTQAHATHAMLHLQQVQQTLGGGGQQWLVQLPNTRASPSDPGQLLHQLQDRTVLATTVAVPKQ